MSEKYWPEERVFLFRMYALLVISILELNYTYSRPCLLCQPDEHHDINKISYNSRSQTCFFLLKIYSRTPMTMTTDKGMLASIITQEGKAPAFI